MPLPIACIVLTIVSAPLSIHVHTAVANTSMPLPIACIVLTIVSAPLSIHVHTAVANTSMPLPIACIVLTIVSAPIFIKSHTSPAKLAAASNAAVTFLAIVAPVFCRKLHTSLAHSPTFFASDTVISTTVLPAFLIAFQIGSKMFSLTQVPMFLRAFIMPWNIPSTIFSPGSSIVLAGDAMPNALLNPLMNGWNMFSTIQTPIFTKPRIIPRRIPPTISPPQASI